MLVPAAAAGSVTASVVPAALSCCRRVLFGCRGAGVAGALARLEPLEPTAAAPPRCPPPPSATPRFRLPPPAAPVPPPPPLFVPCRPLPLPPPAAPAAAALAPAAAPAVLSSRVFFGRGGAGVVGAPARFRLDPLDGGPSVVVAPARLRLERLEPAPACLCATISL